MCLLYSGCGVRQIRLCLPHSVLKRLRIDARNQLALFDRRIEVDEQLLDLTRNLGADLYRRHRVQRAG